MKLGGYRGVAAVAKRIRPPHGDQSLAWARVRVWWPYLAAAHWASARALDRRAASQASA